MGLIARRVEQALHGLSGVFIGEREGGVVDGHEGAGAAGDEHAPCLLGGGVHVLPGFVGADAEDGEVDLAEVVEGAGEGGVAGDEGAASGALDEVTVVSAAPVEGGASAPVLGADGGDPDAALLPGCAPVELEGACEAPGDEAAGAARGDDHGASVGERGEGGAVEVVEVGMGDEDEINRGEGGHLGCAGLASEPEDGAPHADADASAEDGVGDDPEPGDAEEDGRVPQPDRSELAAGHLGVERRRDGRSVLGAEQRTRQLARVAAQAGAEHRVAPGAGAAHVRW